MAKLATSVAAFAALAGSSSGQILDDQFRDPFKSNLLKTGSELDFKSNEITFNLEGNSGTVTFIFDKDTDFKIRLAIDGEVENVAFGNAIKLFREIRSGVLNGEISKTDADWLSNPKCTHSSVEYLKLASDIPISDTDRLKSVIAVISSPEFMRLSEPIQHAIVYSYENNQNFFTPDLDHFPQRGSFGSGSHETEPVVSPEALASLGIGLSLLYSLRRRSRTSNR